MGIISGYDGSKARSMLIDEAGLPAALARVSGEIVDDAPADDDGISAAAPEGPPPAAAPAPPEPLD